MYIKNIAELYAKDIPSIIEKLLAFKPKVVSRCPLISEYITQITNISAIFNKLCITPSSNVSEVSPIIKELELSTETFPEVFNILLNENRYTY